MKYAAWILLGIVLGFLLGGLGPRRELAAASKGQALMAEQLLDAQRRAGNCGARTGLGMPGFQQILSPTAQAAPADREPADVPLAVTRDTGNGGQDGPPVPAEPSGSVRRDLSMAEFDAAVMAQKIRISQNRAALQQQADLDDDAMASLDAAFAEMNEGLVVHGHDVLDMVLGGSDPSTTDVLYLTHEVTGTLYEAQVSMEEIIGADYLDQVDEEALQAWNFIDLDPFRDAMESILQENQ